MRRDHRFLRGHAHRLIASFRNGDRIEPHAQPVFQPLLRAIVFAMRQASKLDLASHVARIDR